LPGITIPTLSTCADCCAEVDDATAQDVPLATCQAHYWGVCPECGHRDGYLNVGKGHWLYCREHRIRWFIGSNLFSNWKDETEDEQRAKYDALDFGDFRTIDFEEAVA
jgi:hypothetical protein